MTGCSEDAVWVLDGPAEGSQSDLQSRLLVAVRVVRRWVRVRR
jgi:hypothetical protein